MCDYVVWATERRCECPEIAHDLVQYGARRTTGSRCYDFAELVARDTASLDAFWLRDEALDASANRPAPQVIAAEIAEDMRAALATFEELHAALAR